MTILVNGKEIESFIFPGGECHVRLNSIRIGVETYIHADLNNSNDVMKLLLTVDAVRNVMPITHVYLVIPYFPYARQDRICNGGEAFSLRVMASLINSLDCYRVTILDLHSEVTHWLINNVRSIGVYSLISHTVVSELILKKNLILVSPDNGALGKINDMRCNFSSCKPPLDVVRGSKNRDPLTGKISDFEIVGNVKGRKVIIIDDICDGGGTFIGLSKVLKEKGANKIYLYVTHGIFSKGLKELLTYIEHIYCYHLVGNYINPLDDRLTIIGDKNDY